MAINSSKSNVTQFNQSDIQPRMMDFEFDDSIPRYWFAGDQFKTLLLTALSCTFPEGERFFVRSVRHYQKQLRSPLLKQQVKGFIGQESHHGKEHESFNTFMQRKGFPTAEIDRFVQEGLAKMDQWMSPRRKLAKTCALEHFTAMLAELVLENDDFLGGMDQRMLPLWIWHAIEESEHKAVAFDVYAEQEGSYWVRASEMAFTTVEFLSFTALHYWQLQRGQEDKADWRSVVSGFNWLVGRPGWLRKVSGHYLSYYRPGFHPSQKNTTVERERALKKLAKLLHRPELNVA